MTDEILLNPRTKSALIAISKNPPPSTIIYGEPGIGKATVAGWLAKSLLGQKTNVANLIEIKPGNSITIEQIRELKQKLRLQIPGNKKIRRLVIVHKAHLLSIDAANAMLKIIEEPPEATIFLLTTTTKNSVLPTIRSRSVMVQVLPVADDELHRLASSASKLQDLSTYLLISDGRPASFHKLLNDGGLEQLQELNQAKKFLASDSFERLMYASTLNDKEMLQSFLDSLEKTARIANKSAVSKNNKKAVQKWLKILRQIQRSKQLNSKNISTKLIITDLCLSL